MILCDQRGKQGLLYVTVESDGLCVIWLFTVLIAMMLVYDNVSKSRGRNKLLVCCNSLLFFLSS